MRKRRRRHPIDLVTVPEALERLREWGVEMSSAGLRYNLRHRYLPGRFDGYRWYVRLEDLRRFRLSFYD